MYLFMLFMAFMLVHEAWRDMYNHVAQEWKTSYVEISNFLFVIRNIPDIQTL